ncbi:MAG: hypothetical protein RL213_737 [Bacteroidota bacterium]|jgi:hypothetical protein
MKAPSEESLNDYYRSYYRYLVTGDLLKDLSGQMNTISGLLAVPSEREGYAYAPGKWDVRTVVGHLVDTERIFSYRILCLARRDTTPLPGFDENVYAINAGHGSVPLSRLVNEWTTVRLALMVLLDSLDDEALDFGGTANGKPVTARQLVFMVFAHAAHHLQVLRDRYGLTL